MASLADKLPSNAPGELFVDHSCIDCETCRMVAPTTFGRDPREGKSTVIRQPAGEAELHRALMALVACPTASIGTRHRQPAAAAAASFPDEIAPGIFYCGYAAESSYGASSWLLRRPGGNLLVDSPRAARPLLKRLGELGGVAQLFLTHADDVADHQKLRDHFGLVRTMHEADVGRDTASVEQQLAGGEPVRLAEDLLAIPVPGHTAGSCALLYRDEVLFTGDHLWGDEETGRLGASSSVCWYSWDEQIESMERLLFHRFTRVLPGHGRPYLAASPEAMRRDLERLIAEMRRR